MKFNEDKFTEDLRSYVNAYNTLEGAAREAGLPRSTLFYALNGRVPTMEVFVKCMIFMDKRRDHIYNYFTK